MFPKHWNFASVLACSLGALISLPGCGGPVEFDPGEVDPGESEIATAEEPLIAGQVVTTPSGWEKRLTQVNYGGCSGTLLTEDWVLTAAHCLTTKGGVVTYPRNFRDIPLSHIFLHPDKDVALGHLYSRVSTGYSGTLPLYTGSESALPGKSVTSYGFGWDAVDWDAGMHACETDEDCAAGYRCAETFAGWCVKSSSTLRKYAFKIDSLADSDTRYILRKTNSRLLAPGDSGGPSVLSDGTIVGVHSATRYDLSYSKDVIVPDAWITRRLACPLFDIKTLGDICTSSCPCDIGQGDCDQDSDCMPGLACRQYGTGRHPHGFTENFDICVDPDCPTVFDPASPPGSGCQRSAGEPFCEGDDSYCGGNLTCTIDIGKALDRSLSSGVDVCVNPPSPGCSKDACTPTCPCDLGEICQANADCRPGLMCAKDKGGLVGRSATDDICVEPAALTCSSDAECPGGTCWLGGCRLIQPVVVLPPAASCGYIDAGEGLYPNQPFYSCDGRFRLYLQSDSNLVLSQKDTQGNFSMLVWKTGSETIGKDGYSLVMQGDGNLVLYDSVRVKIWATNTSGHTGEGLYARVGNDAQLQVRTGSQRYWSSVDH